MTHPRRKQRARSLAERLGASVVIDPEPETPGAWSCARRAWGLGRDGRATHRLVVQDDAVPCEDFVRRASAAICRRPFGFVAFYVGDRHAGARRLHAEARHCEAWHELERGHFIPTVALAMPVNLAIDLSRWDHANLMDQRYDDEIIGAFRTAYDVPAWATIPCLVEHDSREPSLLHPEHGRRGSCCPFDAYTGSSPWASPTEESA